MKIVGPNNKKIITQWGTEAVPFAIHNGLEKLDAINNLQAITRDFSSFAECQFVITFGTLLGTIRDGNLIAHDFDFDLAFFPNSNSKDDVIPTAERIIQRIEDRGMDQKSKSYGHLTTVMQVGETPRNVDLTAGWIESGRVMQYAAINGEVSESEYFPLKSSYLCGCRVLVPFDPKAVLETVYGANWRIPNPNHKQELSFENFSFLFFD